jgi:hypothetical protein
VSKFSSFLAEMFLPKTKEQARKQIKEKLILLAISLLLINKGTRIPLLYWIEEQKFIVGSKIFHTMKDSGIVIRVQKKVSHEGIFISGEIKILTDKTEIILSTKIKNNQDFFSKEILGKDCEVSYYQDTVALHAKKLTGMKCQ